MINHDYTCIFATSVVETREEREETRKTYFIPLLTKGGSIQRV